ncbi:hypothetical protein OE88DRAFT_1649298 [Heliocybe sulcata]|uniref:Uncharacterized protein n=1 Tax=Heliocybe sulcata TaxID=5364 RepID=A0A5C3MJD7_9AGAM|nr:hypothetical protein OE88DRAFT_1649298 [Heliocybe sulcata]
MARNAANCRITSRLYDATAATVPGTNIALRIRNGTPLFRNALGEPAGPLHSMELAGFYDLRLGRFMVVFHPRYNSFIVVATEKGSKNLRSLRPLEKRLLDRFSVRYVVPEYSTDYALSRILSIAARLHHSELVPHLTVVYGDHGLRRCARLQHLAKIGDL